MFDMMVVLAKVRKGGGCGVLVATMVTVVAVVTVVKVFQVVKVLVVVE